MHEESRREFLDLVRGAQKEVHEDLAAYRALVRQLEELERALGGTRPPDDLRRTIEETIARMPAPDTTTRGASRPGSAGAKDSQTNQLRNTLITELRAGRR